MFINVERVTKDSRPDMFPSENYSIVDLSALERAISPKLTWKQWWKRRRESRE